MLWLWRDTGDSESVAALAQGTFWLVLPTLPLFLVLPALLRHGVAVWAALAASCLLTVAPYLLTVSLLPKFGISLNRDGSASHAPVKRLYSASLFEERFDGTAMEPRQLAL